MNPEYFGLRCKKCGWVGSSEEACGVDVPIDRGKFPDLACPACSADGYSGQPLVDVEENELCDEIVRLRCTQTRRTPTDSALWEAAERLVKKLDFIHNHPSYQSVWDCSYVHQGQYKGPQYVKELAGLRTALSSTTTPEATP